MSPLLLLPLPLSLLRPPGRSLLPPCSRPAHSLLTSLLAPCPQLDCGLATPEFSQARVTGCFERANKVDKQVAHSKQVGKAAMAKPDKIEAKDTGLQLQWVTEDRTRVVVP